MIETVRPLRGRIWREEIQEKTVPTTDRTWAVQGTGQFLKVVPEIVRSEVVHKIESMDTGHHLTVRTRDEIRTVHFRMKTMYLLMKNPGYYLYPTCFLDEFLCLLILHRVILCQPIIARLIEDMIMVGFKTHEMIYDRII
jgi:hypothetical protein